MGLTCSLHRGTEADVARLLADPASVAGFLDPDDGRAPSAGSTAAREICPRPSHFGHMPPK